MEMARATVYVDVQWTHTNKAPLLIHKPTYETHTGNVWSCPMRILTKGSKSPN